MMLAMAASLALVVVECTRQRAWSPAVIGDRGAVLHGELDPYLLIAAERGRRVRACPNEQVTDLDHTVQAVAQECRYAQCARELVRYPGGLRPYDDVLRPQHQQRFRARSEAVRQRADHRAAEGADPAGHDLAWEERRLADEVRDEPGGGLAIQIAGRALLDDLPGLHHGDTVGEEQGLAPVLW